MVIVVDDHSLGFFDIFFLIFNFFNFFFFRNSSCSCDYCWWMFGYCYWSCCCCFVYPVQPFVWIIFLLLLWTLLLWGKKRRKNKKLIKIFIFCSIWELFSQKMVSFRNKQPINALIMHMFHAK